MLWESEGEGSRELKVNQVAPHFRGTERAASTVAVAVAVIVTGMEETEGSTHARSSDV